MFADKNKCSCDWKIFTGLEYNGCFSGVECKSDKGLKWIWKVRFRTLKRESKKA